MSATPNPTRRRYPLHVTISVAFTALLAVVGLGLVTYNYVESRKMALLAADDLLDRIDEHMQVSVEGLYGPVENVVDIAAKTMPPNSHSTDHGMRSLGFASEVLRLKHDIASIFVGYEDGDFYLLRRVEAWPGIREFVTVPEGTIFVLESVERQREPELKEWLFYGSDLELIGQASTPWDGFDPRERDWYVAAMGDSGQVATDFYRFFTTRDIGATVARRLTGSGGVVGADMTLRALSAALAGQQVTPSSRIAMLNRDGTVIVLPDLGEELAAMERIDGEHFEMPHVTELNDPVYEELAGHLAGIEGTRRLELLVNGRVWLVSLSELPTRWGEPIVLATIIPRDELLAQVIAVRDKSVLISAAMLAVALLIVVGLSRNISRSLRTLAAEAEQIRELRLETPITVRSSIREVDDLASTMSVMKDSLQQFLAISQALSAEKNFDRLLEMILDEACRVSGAEGGAVLLLSEDEQQLDVAILRHRATGITADDDVAPVSLRPTDSYAIEPLTIVEGVVLRVDDTSGTHGFDLDGVQKRFAGDSTPPIHSVLCAPLRNQQDEVIGVLQLVDARGHDGTSSGFSEETVPYIEALSSNAAIALDNRRLLKAQRDLLESFIHVVAGAIDAKSPYTHGHCQRVPVVAQMLAEAADAVADGPFAGFKLSDDEWYTLHLASWLHDCGKVTTPEYVVDKATKLESLYDRIHEIRMRFEVLWRDAEIDYYRALQVGDADEATARCRRDERRARIRDDFAFIASCNSGDTFVSDDMVERIRSIGAATWQRNLDDSIGISHGERSRRGERASPALPVMEPLLSDRPEQIIPRATGSHPYGDNEHGFKMEVPENLYNLGEIHNLCIRRGTLTAEERFKINEHVVQTIRMLGRLPFPRELRNVPTWAGNHHEKLDGTGYPRRIAAEDLSIPERIMAMADIFEALTASDRPYMPPKTLSKVVGIMRSMCDDGHLDPELFDLLLRSGVHLRYAEQHLRPQQIDDVDIDAVLAPARQSGRV